MDTPSAFLVPAASSRTPISAQVCASLLPYFLPTAVSGEPLRSLGIQRLPYQLSLVDLITKNALVADLFVWLPTEYFVNWKNFPEMMAKFEPSPEGKLKTAQHHCVYIVPTGTFSTEDLLHP